jgi:hypothetical protein
VPLKFQVWIIAIKIFADVIIEIQLLLDRSVRQ